MPLKVVPNIVKVNGVSVCVAHKAMLPLMTQKACSFVLFRAMQGF